MSLESEIKKLTAAIVENNKQMEALRLTATEAPASGSRTADAPKTSPAKAEPAPEPPKEPEAESSKADAPAGAKVDKKTVADRVLKVARTKSREAAVNIMAPYGASSVPELPADSYAAVVAACDELLGEDA